MTAQNWPGDADTVIRWLRESLRAGEAQPVRGLEAVRISAEMSGSDLELLVIDASGTRLTLIPPDAGATPLPPPSAAEPAVVQRTAGTIRSARVMAAPMRLEKVPITLDIQLYDAPVEWLEYERPVDPDRPETIHSVELTSDGRGMRGALSASIRTGDVGPLLSALIRPALVTAGIRLRRLKVDVTQDGADGIRIEGRAGIRWRLFAASARGSARIGVSPDGVVTVRDLRASSFHPLVAVALRAARRSIRSQIGRTFDLNADLAADGPRLTGVRVVAGDELKVSARLS